MLRANVSLHNAELKSYRLEITGSKLPYYITNYMTKVESAEVDDMWEEVNSPCKNIGQRTMSYLLKYMKFRQV